MKIISGGQTGADRAGLASARKAGLQTGGWMPKGFLAHDGYHPNFAVLYDMLEHESPRYPPRTALNVRDSDGTIRFASNFSTPGELLTLKMTKQYNKPLLSISIPTNVSHEETIQWIKSNNIKVLNVAGNSERSSPGITQIVIEYLDKLFNMLN